MRALDLRDVRSTLDEAALDARMSVDWGDAAVDGKDNEWRAFGEWTTKLEAGRPNPNPEITAEAQQLVAGAPDLLRQAQEHYRIHPEKHPVLHR